MTEGTIRFEDLVLGEASQHFFQKAVEMMALAKRDFLSAPSFEAQCDASHRLLKWGLRATALAIGPDALDLVHGTPVQDDRKLALLRAWYRVGLMEPLFAEVDQADDLASFKSLQTELLAIANDDSPRLFDRIEGGKSGVRRNTYRLAHHKARALGWEAYLRANGYSAGKAQNLVSDGFGRTWVAIKDWKPAVEEALGAENVAMVLLMAAEGTDMHYANALCKTDVAGAIRIDGMAFAEEERRNSART